jgi:dTDP-4-amino-4,6-dideoxygalactose transaminase
MSDVNLNFDVIADFEKQIAEFFGAPHAVAVDSCTHGVELCLRHTGVEKISVPKNTYISIPFLADKLSIHLEWRDEAWKDYYYLTPNVVDAAVLWKRDSYVPGTLMSVSFQFRKHLSLGRGGIILLDDPAAAKELKKMSYDGRIPSVPWRDQDITSIGYHYYMTPETANMGLQKLPKAIETPPKQWVVSDWPDLTKMRVFKNV